MIKVITLLFALLVMQDYYAQEFTIEEFKAIDQFETESVFPIVENKKNQRAAKKINEYLHYHALGKVFDENDTARFSEMFPPEDEFSGNSLYEYEILRNDKTFLSVAISYDFTGAYTENHTEYYTFASSSGERLDLIDFFAVTPYETVSEIMYDKVATEIDEFMLTIDQETEYGYEQYQMYNECLEYVRDGDHWYPSSFYVRDTAMFFVRERCSNHMRAALDDLWGFQKSMPFDVLDNFFNQSATDAYHTGKWNSNQNERIDGKILSGTINKKYHVTALIDVLGDGKTLSGYYWYDKVKKKITLEGELKDGKCTLTEIVNGKQTGHFTGVFEAGRISGEWQNVDNKKSFPFELTIY